MEAVHGLAGATQLAIGIGAIIFGAGIGAGISTVNHCFWTGSWSGTGKADVDGAVDVCANGFVTS